MKWMIDITFKEGSQAEVGKLVQQERQHVVEGKAQGLIDTLYLSAPDAARPQAWLIVNGDNEEQVRQYLSTFPMFPYMTPTIVKLS
ncbi:muconolactone Delta-isomerase family protein [Dictyobacter kobayashii]|uniref:Muconolactone isomerase domain-containing protein n=1 Tax=Dictyobacter kobayashii TaxID=2014872 RepID=A0A402AUF5_9CHLR|nr:muconolactone Delta-isomerase family protein [Dictyobacter kobayashii]GCE22717.1 hypothetical protein KDK_65170 [Dictyobacter kobayashii]